MTDNQYSEALNQPICACGHNHGQEPHHETCGHHDGHNHHHDCCKHHDHSHHHGCGCGHDHNHHQHEYLGKTITFEGEIKADKKAVWKALTTQQAIDTWAPFLKINQLQPLGSVSQIEAKFENVYTIFDVENGSFLSFAWYQSIVSFEVMALGESQTFIRFIMTIEYVEERHIREIQNWLIGLQKLAALVQGEAIPDFEEELEKIYDDIANMLQSNQSHETVLE